MTFCALVLSMAGATLVYLASAQQKLLSSPWHASTRVVALALLLGGTATWLAAEGIGAGIAATLTTWMFTWVALPYLAWWRDASESARVSPR